MWLCSGIGAGDDLAPPVGDGFEAWELQFDDLFDGCVYEYIGTVEVAEDIDLWASDSERRRWAHRTARHPPCASLGWW